MGGRFGPEDDGQTPNTLIASFDYGDAEILLEMRGLRSSKFRDMSIGTIFECEKGSLVSGAGATAAYTPKNELIEKFTGGGDHFRNFVDAVKARRRSDLASEVLEGHLSTSLCHLANISCRLGERRTMGPGDSVGRSDEARDMTDRLREHLKDNDVDLAATKACFGKPLSFDPKSEAFLGDAGADALLRREYRKPFVVPDEV